MKRGIAIVLSAAVVLALAWGEVYSQVEEGRGEPARRSRPATPRGIKSEPHLTKCLVVPREDIRVPAEEAGVLTAVNTKEGEEVKKRPAGSRATGEHKATEVDAPTEIAPLIEVDPSTPIRQRKVAGRALTKARADAKNMVNRDYAIKAAEVARAAWDKVEEANRRVKDSVSTIERQRLKLDWERALLQIKQAEHETKIAELTAGEKEEELGAAADSIKRRRIFSPIDGTVVQIYVQEGEWVKPGDPVLRVINLKRLRVQGLIRNSEYGGGEVAGMPVTVTATLTDGRQEAFPGVIQFVHPEVQAGGLYMVWAEVDNRKDGTEYLLQPGMDVDMVIHTRGARQSAKR